MQNTVIQLDSKLKLALQVYGAKNQRTMKDLITEAIEDLLHKHNVTLDT